MKKQSKKRKKKMHWRKKILNTTDPGLTLATMIHKHLGLVKWFLTSFVPQTSLVQLSMSFFQIIF
jgi:hypothetical protein